MEQFVLNNMVIFDCAVYAIMTLYGILLVSWFFDTRIWNWFEELIEELQVITIILGVVFGVWYMGCAIFGWEYRLIPHIIGLMCFGIIGAIVVSVHGWCWVSDLRDEVVNRRRKNRY